MTDTANLGLPCIEGSQAQKHVTHNEALRILDTLVQLAVNDRDLAVPPGSPAEGQRWIVKSGASGVWAGHVNEIAAWQDGSWQFATPKAGWLAYVIDEGALLAFAGGAWIDAIAALTSLNNLTLLGLGTTADAANPLSVRLNNAMFAARTVAGGGDGNLRCKLSKESAAKSLSLLFQDNYSGRAEIGLCGDDDFRFKVSPDGSAWFDGIVIDRTTGAVSFPNTAALGGRERLAADRTYYVRTDGSDANSGLANTAGGAWLTLQKAMDTIAGALDLNGRTVTVQIGDGTYTAGVSLKPWTGGGGLVFKGNNAAPSNVFVSCTAANCFENALGTLPGNVTIRDVKLGTTTSGYCISCPVACTIKVDNVNFAAAQIHMLAFSGVVIDISKNYTISGGGLYHWYCFGGLISNSNAAATVSISGTPAFTKFGFVTGGGLLYCANMIFGGAATGQRYAVDLNGVLFTGGGGASFLPGSSAGTTATGGQYV